MNRSIQLVVLLTAPLFLVGCLTPVKNEIPLVGGGLSAAASDTNDTRLVIFNDSNFVLYGLDGSGRINVKLNGKGVAQIRIGYYAQVIVPKGSYQVDLTHRDTADFTSHHEIELANAESFLEIHSTMVSNEAILIPALPEDFEKKFKPIK